MSSRLRKLFSKSLSQKSNEVSQQDRCRQRITAVCYYDPNFAIDQHKITEGYKPPKLFIDRIKRSYRTHYATTVISEESMWSRIDSLRRPLHDALLADDDSAQRLLEDPGSCHLLYGLDESFTTDMMLFNQANDFDKLVRLSEALGRRRAYNPDTSDFLQNETAPGEAVVDQEVERICDAVGLPADFRFPSPFRDTSGIQTSRGLLDQRTIQSLYQAHRIRVLGGNDVLEIGAGVGRTALYAVVLGAASYSIVDLPLTLVCQALFLGSSIGEKNIRLAGEDDLGQKIQLFSTEDMPKRKFDLVFNADSFSEMAIDVATSYIEYSKKNARLLLSINHESNPFTVASLLPPTPHRYPYWLRKGYMEEIFSFA